MVLSKWVVLSLNRLQSGLDYVDSQMSGFTRPAGLECASPQEHQEHVTTCSVAGHVCDFAGNYGKFVIGKFIIIILCKY